ncbi:alpha/beta fold hydrolase [Streptomyces sp. HB2AG]|uniref:alpha/beta fold hydrolase n=1 Tax=Streptomyces sp. HB2AG TaxID=2983400 RepID=UPI0022AA4FC3|nr:alpha/beta hydrolase [Streptomyces sp. HB2AG]MCZ2525230.1 alpha/beta fold hydrolase [Streptomyces sp. HB2AG]
MDHLMPGITARRVPTARVTTHVLEAGEPDGTPVVFVHGNVSSALFWQPTMLALPAGYRAVAPDLRGFGSTDRAPVDATRGLRDFSDDLGALLDALGLPAAHLVGWSMGGGVVLQHLLDAPGRVASLTLVNPVSPFGFGGTKGPHGELCAPDGAGSGGGAGNPDFVARLAAGDTGDDSPLSPRRVLLAQYVKEGCVPEPLEAMVHSMLTTATGDDHYPGTSAPSGNWPGFAPGDRGVLNTMAPTHFRITADDLAALDPKPPVLWIRGADDVIVSDTSMHDLAHLGSLGIVPGWPGEAACPPQPMVTQTRTVLDGYAKAGGRYTETVIEDSGHGPQLDRPEEFRAALLAHLAAAAAV